MLNKDKRKHLNIEQINDKRKKSQKVKVFNLVLGEEENIIVHLIVVEEATVELIVVVEEDLVSKEDEVVVHLMVTEVVEEVVEVIHVDPRS